MGFFDTLALALGASWTSGLRLYATVATLGLMGRYGGVALPGDLAALTHPWVIGVAAVLALVEFVADKVPLVDSVWDAVQTVVRVPAGAVLAYAAFGEVGGAAQWIALLLGGSLALASHGAKAATRVAVNASPEPVSNVVVSTAEDGLAVGTLALAVVAPAAAVVAVVLAVGIVVWALPRVARAVRGRFGWRRVGGGAGAG